VAHTKLKLQLKNALQLMVYVGYGRLHKDCHIVDTNFHKPVLAIFANVLQNKISAK
jgi:hypothetical protein